MIEIQKSKPSVDSLPVATPSPPAILVADAPGLDFLNSWACPEGEPFEWLADGMHFIEWLEQSGLLEPESAAQMRGTQVPGELDSVAMQAREIREWFRSFVAKYRGAPLPSSAFDELLPLNSLLERDESYRLITPRSQSQIAEHEKHEIGTSFERVLKHRWSSPTALLMPVAEALADVVCSANFTHIKRCEGHGCTLLFLDKTKGHKRRWCSMAICGNRAKQAAYRERMKRGED